MSNENSLKYGAVVLAIDSIINDSVLTNDEKTIRTEGILADFDVDDQKLILSQVALLMCNVRRLRNKVAA